jgi:hypothetical protein
VFARVSQVAAAVETTGGSVSGLCPCLCLCLCRERYASGSSVGMVDIQPPFIEVQYLGLRQYVIFRHWIDVDSSRTMGVERDDERRGQVFDLWQCVVRHVRCAGDRPGKIREARMTY